MQFSAQSAPPGPPAVPTAQSTHLKPFFALIVWLTVCLSLASVLSLPNFAFSAYSRSNAAGAAPPVSNATITGKVTYQGTPKKLNPIDMSAEPSCAKLYSSSPLPESSLTGPQNTLQNVIVYISQGAADDKSPSTSAVRLNQRGCRYTPHVISVDAGQEVWVQNDDLVTHTVHPLSHANTEWNRSQPPGTPPLVIRYDQPEFIRVKCELHSWMRGVLAVFKNSHHSVTDNNGAFALPDLPPGKYTVTAWHELYGAQSKQITITAGENKDLDFVFHVNPY